MSDGSLPLVSVLMLAYQNEAYVERAIGSVLSQKCTFPFELVIGEDASTDSTLDAIRRAVNGSEVPVRVCARPKNLGMHRNYDLLLRGAKAPYVANIDGDDEWVDDHKLQKQVDQITADPTIAMVFGRSEAVDRNGESLPAIDYTRPRQFATIDELFVKCDIPHSTILFRRKFLPQLPDWFFVLPNYDWASFLVFASKGTVAGLPDVLARYTWHWQGSSSGRSDRQHFDANAAHYVALKREFGALLSVDAMYGAKRRLEDCLSWAFVANGAITDLVPMAAEYFRVCNTLAVAPSYWWLLGEARRYLTKKIMRRHSRLTDDPRKRPA